MESFPPISIPPASWALLGTGILIAAAGAILFLVDAFRVGIGWGLAVLLIPFANLAFALVHWPEAKRGFLAQLAGGILVGCALIPIFGAMARPPSTAGSPAGEETRSANPLQTTILQMLRQKEALKSVQEKRDQMIAEAAADEAMGASLNPAYAAVTPARDLGTRIEANRRKFDELAEWFARLETNRKELKSSDPAAVKAFNAEAARYRAALAAAKAESEEIRLLSH